MKNKTSGNLAISKHVLIKLRSLQRPTPNSPTFEKLFTGAKVQRKVKKIGVGAKQFMKSTPDLCRISDCFTTNQYQVAMKENYQCFFLDFSVFSKFLSKFFLSMVGVKAHAVSKHK